ncbi:Hypothetical_protein [Hexamita inflata]|uniref:Hypothetical_protein n=1 Tax=Hexamita inflata TaxID=28002 RepID=A0AA86R8E5_9EUKA|nr:Hypothetical protein HINF_LOCUS56876 [Hexamita inflata]
MFLFEIRYTIKVKHNNQQQFNWITLLSTASEPLDTERFAIKLHIDNYNLEFQLALVDKLAEGCTFVAQLAERSERFGTVDMVDRLERSGLELNTTGRQVPTTF